jgi:lycopene beta-cyclase
MQSNKRYDIIIAGAGAAGLSLIMHLIDAGYHTDKKILLIDREKKNTNDRTWCFWEKENGLFEELVFRKWNHVYFKHSNFNEKLNIAPYQYKMLRGIDFYNHCLKVIREHQEIEFVQEEIIEAINVNGVAEIKTATGNYFAPLVFSSILEKQQYQNKNCHYLLQHFKGWIIKSFEPVFDTGAATFMDFRIEQKGDTRFVYILPFDANTAMVEYTVFSKNILRDDEYDDELRKYITEFCNISSFEIIDTEFGVIPMTDFKFKQHDGNIYYLGTAGGQTKASTGFTFQFIQQQCKKIAVHLAEGKNIHDLSEDTSAKRFRFYDSVLLNILSNKKLEGKEIFKTMFQKSNPALVLKFLENKTTNAEEIKLFLKLPVLLFFKTAIQELVKGK